MASELQTGLKMANLLNLDRSLQVLLDLTCLVAHAGCVVQVQVKGPNLAHRRANRERKICKLLPPQSVSQRFTGVQLLTLLPRGVQEAVGTLHVH